MSSQSEAAQILDQPAPAPAIQKDMGGAIKDEGTPPAHEKVSSKLEVLIKREQAALFRERLAKQKEAELEAKMQAFQEKEREIQEFQKAKGNSKEALKHLGLTYDELTRAELADGQIPPEVQIKKIEEKFDAFKSQKEQEEKARQDEAERQARAQEQKAIDTFKVEINSYLTDNKDRYEFINFEGEQQLVFDVVDEHYNRTLYLAQRDFQAGKISQDQVIGKVMSIKEAADKVEEHLEKKYNKAKELNKTKALWGSVPKAPLQEALKPQTNKPQPSKTLTNQLSAKVQTPTVNRMITDEERVQKAIAYARGLRPS